MGHGMTPFNDVTVTAVDHVRPQVAEDGSCVALRHPHGSLILTAESGDRLLAGVRRLVLAVADVVHPAEQPRLVPDGPPVCDTHECGEEGDTVQRLGGRWLCGPCFADELRSEVASL